MFTESTRRQSGRRLRNWPWTPVLAIILGFGAFWLLFFWSILVRRSHFIPWDLIDQHYMFQGFISRTLGDDDSLWWSPNIMGGYPVIADPLSALFYPPNLLMHLLVPRDFLPYLALELQATLHFLLAAVGTFLLARMLTGSNAGGIVAGLTWAFGSYFVWHLPHLSPISTLSWLPWILLAYAMAIRHGSLVWTGLAALATGVMMLAGHAMTILQISYLLIGFSVVLAVLRWGLPWFERLRPAIVAGVALALGAGIAAIQLLPGWQLSGISERADFGFSEAADSSFAPYWSITALIPNFFSVFDPGEYWAAGDPAETNLYMGLIPLALAAIGIVGSKLSDRRTTLLILAGTIVAMLLSFGTFAWPFQIAYDLLPGFDRVRRPATFIAFAQFGIALLAAFGVKALTEPTGDPLWSRLSRWLGIGAALVLGMAAFASVLMVTTIGEPAQQQFVGIISGAIIAGVVLVAGFAIARSRQGFYLSGGTAIALLIALVAVDLGSAHKAATYQNEEMPPNQYVGEDWVYGQGDDLVPTLRELTKVDDPYRILPVGTASVWANGPFVWDLHSASGYITLCPLEYCELLEVAQSDPTSPIAGLLNIRYLVTDEDLEERFGEHVADRLELAHDGWTPVYANPNALTRVWTTTSVTILDEEDVLAHLVDNPERIGEEVVLSDPDAPVTEAGDDSGQAEIQSYDNTRVVVDASMPDDGYLFVADTWYPGWSASIDGEETEIFRANHAFRAVHVPAGNHEVEFSYQQPWLREGAVVSIVSVLLTIGIAGVGIIFQVRRR